jgi:hypothetical protein
MNPVPRSIRLQVMMTPEEIRAIDDWRFEHRLPSRAAAIRKLMRRGLRGMRRMSGRVSKSRSITEADRAERDLKTVKLRKQREARDADEAKLKKGKKVELRRR